METCTATRPTDPSSPPDWQAILEDRARPRGVRRLAGGFRLRPSARLPPPSVISAGGEATTIPADSHGQGKHPCPSSLRVRCPAPVAPRFTLPALLPHLALSPCPLHAACDRNEARQVGGMTRGRGQFGSVCCECDGRIEGGVNSSARTQGQSTGATGCSFDCRQPAPGKSDAAAADARHSCRQLPTPRATGLCLRQQGRSGFRCQRGWRRPVQWHGCHVG
jgi:hypothetical protein